MWSPANKYAVPSKEERIQATKAIIDLKTEIVDTEEQLARVQLRLVTLRKELREREAWLAPMRKLCHDELAIIFNMCAENDWMAPMDLSGVCRTWRNAVLATPRAWSFIDLKEKSALELFPLFLERSGQHTFHVGLYDNASNEVYAAVTRMADRIRCLAIRKITPLLSQTVFPALTQLVLNDETRPLSVLLLKRSQFPALHHLDICYDSNPDRQIPNEIVDPPAVQTLDISSYKPLDCFHIIKNFAESLKVLRIVIFCDTFFSNKYTIHLPQLEVLSLDDWRRREDSIIPTMVTPRLKKLVAKFQYPTQSFPLHMDLGRLVHLHVYGEQKPPLSSLRGLKVLQFHGSAFSYSEFFEPLLDDSSICPNLETIEIFDDREGFSDLRRMIPRINRFRGGDIKLFFPSTHPPLHPSLSQLVGHNDPCGPGCHRSGWAVYRPGRKVQG